MFQLFTDTSANLPSAYIDENQILVLPFTYSYDGQDYQALDTAAFDPTAYYNLLRKGTKVSTSLINTQTYSDAFEPFLKAGQDVLFVSMSSGISGSYAASRLACQELMEKYPGRKALSLDTMAASLGEGLMVMDAVALRDQGKDVQEVYDFLYQERLRVAQFFTVDDLQHLKRTGRLSGAKAAIGSILQIKPILMGNFEGKIVQKAQVRGRRKSILTLAELYKEKVDHPEDQVVCIAHADCIDDAMLLEETLSRYAKPKRVMMVYYEPVTGSHVGPGTVALFFKSIPEKARS